MLHIENLHTHYGPIEALKGIDLDIHEGEIVTLIGANGAGKSTLLNTICGSPRASAGKIEYRGENLTRVPTHKISQRAGTLSGGEQQMLAIGRGLMMKPKLLLLDEPSLGLAPIIIAQIFDIIRDIRAQGITLFLVEQNAHKALQIADRGYILELGRITHSDSGENLLKSDAVRKAYLGG